jgi:hypothetical protein
MLVVTGGTERTEEEYTGLLADAGLSLDRVHATARPIAILEATRIKLAREYVGAFFCRNVGDSSRFHRSQVVVEAPDKI